MDSSVSPTHGEQELSVWNGLYECIPFSCSTSSAIWSAAPCAPAMFPAPMNGKGVLKPVVARYQGKVSRIYFRADAGFTNPEVYAYLEAEGSKYAIRLPANRVLQERIGHLLARPVGCPPN
jgi:hypothetical protein